MSEKNRHVAVYTFENLKRGLRNEPSTWSLLASNLMVIILAVVEGWNVLTIMWIYWAQSIIIGVFNFIRILTLKEFSTTGMKFSGKPVPASDFVKIPVAIFFLFHYGFFHFGYASFLSSGSFAGRSVVPVDTSDILIASAIFLANHCFSFLYNRERDKEKQNLGRVMFYPYARIVPMHLTIIFGSFFGGHAIVLFLLLKTLADVVMHGAEHRPKN